MESFVWYTLQNKCELCGYITYIGINFLPADIFTDFLSSCRERKCWQSSRRFFSKYSGFSPTPVPPEGFNQRMHPKTHINQPYRVETGEINMVNDTLFFSNGFHWERKTSYWMTLYSIVLEWTSLRWRYLKRKYLRNTKWKALIIQGIKEKEFKLISCLMEK